MNKKWTIIGVSVIIFLAFLVWLFMASNKPLPGIEAKQDGRNHVPEGSPVTYNFNPPTGGDHYASWITKGFYEEPRYDGNLVHSLEHGYVIIWYDCERKLANEFSIFKLFFKLPLAGQISNVYAQTPMTGGSEGSPSAKLTDMPEAFSDGSCDELRNQLRNYYEKDTHKLIVIPRVGLDNRIILTAWGRMLELNSFDEPKIKEFVSAFRNNGPEATNEP